MAHWTPYRTKPDGHGGTLYLWACNYGHRGFGGAPDESLGVWRRRAHEAQDFAERFYDSEDGPDGLAFDLLGEPWRVRE